MGKDNDANIAAETAHTHASEEVQGTIKKAVTQRKGDVGLRSRKAVIRSAVTHAQALTFIHNWNPTSQTR